jgi:hypothetical protein
MKRARTAFFVIFWIFLAHQQTTGSQTLHATFMQFAQQAQEFAQREQFEERRRHFTSGRQLLLDKGVPFEPDELLKDEWSTRLKSTLDSMPEMHQARRETALNGVVMAETLYLPETVQLSGDTVVVTKYLVFEGKNPVIRGAHNLYIFPSQPITVLGTSLAEVLRNQPRLNVKFSSLPVLPSFALVQGVSRRWRNITFDTSGPEPKTVKRPVARQRAVLRGASLPLQFPLLVQDRDTSGSTGQTGTSGTTPPQAANGNSPLKAANGSCAGSLNGSGGFPGGDGVPGQDGSTGGPGGPGSDASDIVVTVADGDLNTYSFIANGGAGGLGGEAGAGGMGGNGGRGGDGGDGVACSCQVGEGGEAGHGGTGGIGGNAGNGGVGGTGGTGGSITVSLPADSPGATSSNSGGLGGRGGDPALGGVGGSTGSAGQPGAGAAACGNTGANGGENFSGNPGNPGKPGTPGAFGSSGAHGPTASITFRQASPPPPHHPCLVDGNGCPCDPVCTPIIIDTENEGFNLTASSAGVIFDISGTGHPIQIAWTSRGSHNAFLALPGSDGLVHNGKELFGNFTPQPPAETPNGFAALALYDQTDHGGNGDGVIDEKDQIFSSLRLWIDENHDGICQTNELHSLADLGVFSINLNYSLSRRTDQFGNVFRYRAKVNSGTRGGSIVDRTAYDVLLTVQ